MDKLITKQKSKRKSLTKVNWPILFFIIISSILFVLPYESYSFSPLYISLLHSALSVSPFYFFLAYLESIILAFIRSPNYGFELAVIGTLFLIVSALPLPFKNRNVRLIFPIALSQITISIFYLVHSLSINTFITLATNTFLTAFFTMTLNQVTNSLKRKQKLDLKLFIPLSLLFTCAFGFISDLALLFFTLSLTVFNYMKTKRSERLTLLFLEVLALLYLVKVDFYLIQILAFPFLFSLDGKKKFNLYLHIILVPLIYMISFPNFYLEKTFYFATIGPLIGATISEYMTLVLNYPKLKNYDERVLELEQRNSVIKDYLLLLKESINREPFSPEHKMKQILDHELCNLCPSHDSCSLKEEAVSLIESKIDNDVTTRVKRVCLFPNKLIYRLKNLKPYYEREKMKADIAKEEKESRDQELDRLIVPLERSLTTTDTNVDLIGPLELQGIKDVEVKVKDDKVIIESLKGLDKNILEKVVSTCYKSPYKATYNQYSFVEHRHIYELEKGQSDHISFVTYKKSYGAKSGDVLICFDEEDTKNIVLADGMGHGDDAYKISTYLVDVFQTVLLLGHDPFMAINETNRLLKIKSESEDYATLDYLSINSATLETRLYKFGSYISYLYRDNILYEYDKVYLPLGISEEQDYEPSHIKFKPGDFFLMASDGISYLERMTLVDIFKKGKSLSDIKSRIVQTIPSNPNDDISFILLRID